MYACYEFFRGGILGEKYACAVIDDLVCPWNIHPITGIPYDRASQSVMGSPSHRLISMAQSIGSVRYMLCISSLQSMPFRSMVRLDGSCVGIDVRSRLMHGPSPACIQRNLNSGMLRAKSISNVRFSVTRLLSSTREHEKNVTASSELLGYDMTSRIGFFEPRMRSVTFDVESPENSFFRNSCPPLLTANNFVILSNASFLYLWILRTPWVGYMSCAWAPDTRMP